ncbi:MAG: Trm112 family protein [Alphaproteobacteria bacterium]|nr:Trm112 family protein [Alphaproteobacteria bacterium]
MLPHHLLDLLVCPATKQPLVYDKEASELISEKAGLAYPIHNNIPILLIEEARIIDTEKAKIFRNT